MALHILWMGCAWMVMSGCEPGTPQDLVGDLGRWTGEPPIVYESVTVVVADRGALHRRAGLYVTLANTAEVTVTTIAVAGDLYDGGGAPYPRSGANAITATLETELTPGETGAWCLSLDSLATSAPAGLQVARFRVTEVHGDAGLLWRNPGSYVYEDAAGADGADGADGAARRARRGPRDVAAHAVSAVTREVP